MAESLSRTVHVHLDKKQLLGACRPVDHQLFRKTEFPWLHLYDLSPPSVLFFFSYVSFFTRPS